MTGTDSGQSEGATPLNFSGARVLVTGAAGFLGRHLVEHLVSENAEILAVSRTARVSTTKGVRWLRAELSDWDQASSLITQTKPDFIFHFGGFVSASPALGTMRPTFESLLASTIHLLTVATELGCCRRIVLPGSMMEPPPGVTDVVPMSPYMAAKWAGSTYARMFTALYRTPIVIVRPSMTYGPGQPAARLVPYVISSLLRGETPKLSSGAMEADWTYVDDMIEGILAAAHAPNVEGLTIDLGTGTTTTAHEVVELIIDVTGTALRPVFGVLPDRPGERSNAADTRLARERLRWTASTSLREGLRRTVEWHREHPETGAQAPGNERAPAPR